MNKKHGAIKVAFAGGGTGGHIYPGLGVADALRALCAKNGVDVKIFWIGNASGMDRNIVEKNVDAFGKRSADAFYGIPSGKLRRYFSFRNFLDVFKILAGFLSSFFILLRLKPALLFSKGGFVSVPPCIAARLLGIPVFTHECDFTPGLATRINAGFAKNILVSFEKTKDYLASSARKKVIVTGNPIRPIFYSADAERGRSFLGIQEKRKPILLVVGGSLGSREINLLVKENLSWICSRFFLVHQTGEKNFDSAPPSLEKDSSLRDYMPYPFIYSQMPDVIACSDVVLSRAGANSIWECSALSKPMILVPLTGSGTRGDQEDNARFFEKSGAALVLSGKDATSENLRKALENLLLEEERKNMSFASGKLSEGVKPAEKIAEILYNEANS